MIFIIDLYDVSPSFINSKFPIKYIFTVFVVYFSIYSWSCQTI